MNSLENINKICLKIMREDKRTNADDMYLYGKVAEYITEKMGTYDQKVADALNVIENHNDYGLPNYSSVLRMRAKLHSEFPQLKLENIDKIRKDQKDLYRKFFKRESQCQNQEKRTSI